MPVIVGVAEGVIVDVGNRGGVGGGGQGGGGGGVRESRRRRNFDNISGVVVVVVDQISGIGLKNHNLTIGKIDTLLAEIPDPPPMLFPWVPSV